MRGHGDGTRKYLFAVFIMGETPVCSRISIFVLYKPDWNWRSKFAFSA
jgi:hypothetical protein